MKRLLCLIGLHNQRFEFHANERYYLVCQRCGREEHVPYVVIQGMPSFAGWPEGQEPKG